MLRSEKNVTINVRNEHGQLTSQLSVGEWTLARLPQLFMELSFVVHSGLIFDELIKGTMKSNRKLPNLNQQSYLHD